MLLILIIGCVDELNAGHFIMVQGFKPELSLQQITKILKILPKVTANGPLMHNSSNI